MPVPKLPELPPRQPLAPPPPPERVALVSPPVPPVPIDGGGGQEPPPLAPPWGDGAEQAPEVEVLPAEAVGGVGGRGGDAEGEPLNTWQLVIDMDIRAAPAPDSEVVHRLLAGDVVEVFDEQLVDGHAQVRVGQRQWVSKENAEGEMAMVPAPGLVPCAWLPAGAQPPSWTIQQQLHRLRSEWQDFCDRHPQIHQMHETEQRLVHYIVTTEKRTRHSCSTWYDRVLADCSAVMSDPSKPSNQKWMASITCIMVIYFQTVIVGVMPVLLSGWALKQMDSKSTVFLICMSPFPFLVQMMFASVLSKIDHTRNRLWTLHPRSMADSGSGETIHRQSSADQLPPRDVSVYSQRFAHSEPAEQTDLGSVGEDDEVFLSSKDVANPSHVSSGVDKIFHAVPYLKTGVQFGSEVGSEIQSSATMCCAFLSGNLSLGVQHKMPQFVHFPKELKMTWLREWLVLLAVFLGCTCAVGWSASGKAALATCGLESLAYLKKTTGYNLVAYHKACGVKAYRSNGVDLACNGLFVQPNDNTGCSSETETCMCWSDAQHITDLQPKSPVKVCADAGQGYCRLSEKCTCREDCLDTWGTQGETPNDAYCDLSQTLLAPARIREAHFSRSMWFEGPAPEPLTKKECAALADRAGFKYFNYGDPSGRFAYQCFGVNATTDACSSAEIDGGLVHNSEWGFWSVLSANLDGRDECGCARGMGWSSGAGACMADSETTFNEAQRCEDYKADESSLIPYQWVYAMYGSALVGMLLFYSIKLGYREHDLVMPSCVAKCVGQKGKGRKEHADGSVVIAHAQQPSSTHDHVVERWRHAMKVVAAKPHEKRMSPLWLMVLIMILMGSFIFYGWFVNYAIALHDGTVANNQLLITQTDSVMTLDDEQFFRICVEAYLAAADSKLATAKSWDEDKIKSACKNLQTPDLLGQYCSETTWGDIDSNAPWLRAVLDLLLASIIPGLVCVIVGEAMEILFCKAFPTLSNDNGYVFFFLNYLISSNVQRYLIFQFSASSGSESGGQGSTFTAASMFLILYVAVSEWLMRISWKLRKKISLLLKSEFLGTRRKTGLSFEEYFNSEWLKGVSLRAELDVAKTSIEVWAICVLMGAQLIHFNDADCRIWSMISYQLVQLAIEYVTDVVSVKRLIKKHINPVQALVNKNRWVTCTELFAFLMVGNCMIFALPQTSGWARTRARWCVDTGDAGFDYSCNTNL